METFTHAMETDDHTRTSSSAILYRSHAHPPPSAQAMDGTTDLLRDLHGHGTNNTAAVLFRVRCKNELRQPLIDYTGPRRSILRPASMPLARKTKQE
jgi:hypothetical protein